VQALIACTNAIEGRHMTPPPKETLSVRTRRFTGGHISSGVPPLAPLLPPPLRPPLLAASRYLRRTPGLEWKACRYGIEKGAGRLSLNDENRYE